MLKDAAIRSLAKRLIEEDEVTDTVAAVNVAQAAINLVDECNREDVFVEDILAVAEEHKSNGPKVMDALMEKNFEMRVVTGAGVIACLFLLHCSAANLSPERRSTILEPATESVAAEGWKG